MTVDLLVINGPGVVARRGGAVLWAEASDLRRESLLAEIVTRLGTVADGALPVAEYADWLLRELGSPAGGTVPALAFAVPDGEGVVALVHGWGRVTGPGGVVTATGAAVRIPGDLPLAVGRADLAVLADGNSLLDLAHGVVPGGAALMLRRTAPDAAASAAAGRAAVAPAPVTMAAPAGMPAHAAPEPAPAPAPPAPPLPPMPVPAPVATPLPAPMPAPLPRPAPAPAPAPMPAPVVSGPPPAPPSLGDATVMVPPSPTPQTAPEPVAAPPAPQAAPAGPPIGGPVVSLRPEPAAAPEDREPLPLAGAASEPVAVVAAPAAVKDAREAVVSGVNCSRQHFNNPGALYCRVCGISMLQQTHVRVQGVRPPLGVLVCDDGSTYGLDGDYAIGSDPREEPGVVQGLAEPLVLGDRSAGVAPTHVIIHLDGWEVMALNRSPGLPAAVLHRGETQWTPLQPGEWARLQPGSFVGFAGRHVVYESNNRA